MSDDDATPDDDPPAESNTDDDPPAEPTDGSDISAVESTAPGTGTALLRAAIVGFGAVVAAVVGILLFYVLPGTLADLAGVLLALLTALLGARIAVRAADAVLPDYNVAAVSVEGPIMRDAGPAGPLGRVAGTTAEDVVEEIDAADADDAVDALLVELNTPGGEIVPSDEIREAVLRFDGPTLAYASDVCASGGYWIASGCDEVWARDATLVGSIGVIGSRPNVSGLADRVGVSYERYAAGQYKDAGNPLKEPTESDREYLQGLIDDFYGDFVERVAEGRDMDPETVRETEARVYLGTDAESMGLVDGVGTREAVEDRLADVLGVEPSVAQFEPQRGFVARLRAGAERVAAAAGAGVAGAVGPDATDEFRFRF